MFAPDFEDGQNPATNGVSVADAETIQSFEVGVKSILADQRLRLNLAAYIFQIDGQQLTAVGGQYNVATLLNADKTDGYGFEADIEYVPSPYVFASFGLSYNPTEINDPNLTVARCGLAARCTITDPINGAGKVSIDGNSLPYAPEWIFTGILNFQPTRSTGGSSAASTGRTPATSTSSSTSRRSSTPTAWSSGCAWATAGTAASTRSPCSGGTSWMRRSSRAAIDFDNLTGMTNEPRIIGVEFNAKF